VLAIAGPRRGCAAEKRADAAAELADRERLRDVVVRPELEAEDLVELVVAGREHDDRHRALGTEPLAHLEPVELGQHQIEHDQVDVLLPEPLQRLLAVTRVHDPESLALERIGEQFLNRVLVVYEEDRRGLTHRSNARCALGSSD
jgi:hypothetical protein